ATVPEAFEVGQLLLVDGLLKRLRQLARRPRLARLALEVVADLVLDLAGLVGFEDFALALFQQHAQVVDARSEAADRAGVSADGASKFLGRQDAGSAVVEQVIERRRPEVRGRCRRAGELDGVVLLVGVDDTAEAVAMAHGASRRGCRWRQNPIASLFI